MTKEKFIKSLETYIKFQDKIDQFEVIFKPLSEDFYVNLDFHCGLVGSYLEMIAESINKEKADPIEDWLDWWIWETDQGKSESLTATVPELHNGEPFLVKTLDDLWSIIETYTEKNND